MSTKFDKPWLCLLSLTDGTQIHLEQNFKKVYNGSIGIPVRAKYESSYCKFLLNYDFPGNVQEYDLFIIDMLKGNIVDYKYTEHLKENTKSPSEYYLYTEYPQKVFDPRNFSLQFFFNAISKGSKKRLIVMFAGEKEDLSYSGRDFADNYVSESRFTISNYERLNPFFDIHNKFGTEVSITPSEFTQVFRKYLTGITYHVTFIPSSYAIEGANLNYLPLIHNADGEVISFLLEGAKETFLILPDIKYQNELLDDLLLTVLPDRYPELFPFSDKNNWLYSSAYHLPNHKGLLEEREHLERKYHEERVLLDQKIEENIDKFKFLHSLLSETGDELVGALIKYFEWLGIEKVIDRDQTATILKEEDLQLINEGKLVIVEAKGIAGTSKDEDCSQIAKIRFRRMKELNRTDIFALYIVNHQRHLPPLSRNNPPFQSQQIIDAEEDQRGLVTTWQLFKAYQNVIDGFLTKDEIIYHLYDTGLVKFEPTLNYSCLGGPKEVFQKGEIIIIDLNRTTIKIGDRLLISSSGNYKFVKISSIKLNGQAVDKANAGEVGIKIQGKVKETDHIWVKR